MVKLYTPKKIILLFLLSSSAFADMTSFFQAAVKNLKYNKSYTLYKQSNKTSQMAVTYSKYTNFSADAAYSKTYAKLLSSAPGNFDTTEISLHDTVDLFGKNNYRIQTLRLDTKAKKSELDLKKEQLFITLVDMVALYNQTKAQLAMREELYAKQRAIYKKLEALKQNGNITEVEVLRFKNTLTTLQTSIVAMRQEIAGMRSQLQLYAPHEAIPQLSETRILYTKEAFVHHNPEAKI